MSKLKVQRWLSYADTESVYFIRTWRIVYCKTKYDSFYYGQNTANRIFWRYFWLTPFRGEQ